MEILVVLAVLGVLMSLAAPSLRDAYRRSQARNASSEFMLGLTYTRAEAIARNRCVTMCMGNNMANDNPGCKTTGSEWNGGWIIFANPKCDDDPSDASAELLKIYLGDPKGPTIGQAIGSTVRAIRFDSRGSIPISSAREWSVAPVDGIPISVVCTNLGGRIYTNSSASPGCNN
jgi:type IV fimbrial biogenesis protein FimT